jgi:PAS domain S-box-containing protein
VADAGEKLLRVIAGVVPCSGSALAVIDAAAASLRYVAATGAAVTLLGRDGPAELLDGRRASVGHWPDAPGILVPLSSGGRVIGALGVSPVEGETLAAGEAAALGRLAAPVALALDTLLLRQDERRQQAQRDMLATALEMMKQPILVFSPDSVVRYANSAAAREFGYAPDELLGLHLQQLVVRQLTARDYEEVRHAIETTGVWAAEHLQRRQDGSEFPAWVTASPLRDRAGGYLGEVVSVRNLTEERAIADQLRQSEKMVALGELVAGVAHEVNNPLTGISAFAQILDEEELTNDQRESVRLIKREADRAVSVIRDLLTFARKSGPRTVVINLNELAEQMLRLRAYSLRTAGIAVESSLAPDLHPLHGDDRQLQQVLLNLIVNAEHAMAGAARRVLTIRTRNERSRVVIEVADTGTGMSPDVQKRIFEPFFTTKPEGTGTGLGLSVSYGIVQAHRGALTVESAPGAGSTFRITLPAAPAAASTQAPASPHD